MKTQYTALCFFTAFMLQQTSFASAFQVWDEDTASIGNNRAGAAANADSAAAEFYNPAVTVLLHRP